MYATRLRAAWAAVVLAALAPACASVPATETAYPDSYRNGVTVATRVRLLACADSSAFLPGGQAIVTVPAGYGAVAIGGGHSLQFDTGSAPAGAQYRITWYRPYAAFRIEPVGNAPTTFQGAVRLTVNYSPCLGASTSGRPRPPYALYRLPPRGQPEARGGVDRDGRVAALLSGFSIYAVGGN
ncbi:hypothetical protein [Longimicrobium sp.]|uniref:hypothetical protein n=1 Tax=Longimicrobium sp. TaxID=2029185 RepID=UPI002CC17284|nr:hypothetical protein [Longimicrobium sp.]HSU15837.1 hypothetical protein [Longimicrobium sp.]